MKKQNLQKPIYQAALYLRLSNQNLKEKADESDSIANQEALLTAFVNDHPDIEIKYIFKDDGWSGVNFDRPGFQKMMQKVYDGKVNCILVKDLSRLGRNHVETGRYVSQVFPAMGIRLIAVTDRIDSASSNSDSHSLIIPFKDLLNDSYSRDISLKVRSAKRAMRKAGRIDSSFPPYGYRFAGPKENRYYVVDEEAATVIKKIYSWTFDGTGVNEIARRLDVLHIPTPKEHYREYTGKKSVNKDAKWSPAVIKMILKNDVYTGVLRVGKTYTPNYKVKKIIKVPPEEQIVYRNRHEAIISQEEFDIMQDVLSRDMRVYKHNSQFVSVYPLAGYIYCAECGGSMTVKTVKPKGHRYEYYVCAEHRRNKRICSNHTIGKKEVEDIVLKALNLHLHLLFEADDLLKGRSMEALLQPELEKIQIQITKILEDKKKQLKCSKELYQDYQDGILTLDEYKELEEDSKKKIEEMDSNVELLNQEKDSKIKKELANMFWVRKYKDQGGLTKLNRRVIITLLDRVEVTDEEHIKIKFRFGDEFKKYLSKYGDQTENGGDGIDG